MPSQGTGHWGARMVEGWVSSAVGLGWVGQSYRG